MKHLSGQESTSPARPTIFISAGEPSGDLHGAELVRALLARWPEARIVGLGGARMAAAGAELLADVSDLAVMGFAEVAKRLPFFWRLKRRVWRVLEEREVDLVIPIDYPGFNLRLARHSREMGIPVLFYIAPQVWAWHASRARDLARDASRVAVILPFEEEHLRRAGAQATFVGHPLLDLPPPSAKRREWAATHGVDADCPLLALFPGSRPQEIQRHLEPFSDAARLLLSHRPDVQPVIAASPDVDSALYAAAPWPRAPGGELLAHADAALVKSGTTTLEAALAGVPFVVAYRMNPLSHAIARRLVRVPHIALANLVAQRRVVPEFVQDEATPAALAAALLPLFDAGSAERDRMKAGLAGVRDALGTPGAAERVAALAAELLESAQ